MCGSLRRVWWSWQENPDLLPGILPDAVECGNLPREWYHEVFVVLLCRLFITRSFLDSQAHSWQLLQHNFQSEREAVQKPLNNLTCRVKGADETMAT